MESEMTLSWEEQKEIIKDLGRKIADLRGFL